MILILNHFRNDFTQHRWLYEINFDSKNCWHVRISVIKLLQYFLTRIGEIIQCTTFCESYWRQVQQEDAPGTHRTVRQISRETGIPKPSVK